MTKTLYHFLQILGGSLGREGKHDVIIPDINCSKYHMKFTYDEIENGYTCIDLGSRNGTFMNGKRMSNAKQESEPMNLTHGTVLQIGQTKLLCHIHDGHSTCGQCEPGLLSDNTATVYNESIETSTASKPANVSDDHKRQLKNLKKRYGLQDESELSFTQIPISFLYKMNYLEEKSYGQKFHLIDNPFSLCTEYVAPKVDAKNDRAEIRRQKVGSSCEHEKTKAASLNAYVSPTIVSKERLTLLLKRVIQFGIFPPKIGQYRAKTRVSKCLKVWDGVKANR